LEYSGWIGWGKDYRSIEKDKEKGGEKRGGMTNDYVRI
jgi:hypothetical protein